MTARKWSSAAGLERTLKALRPRLTPEDDALVAMARGLAAAVDAEPANAALWRELRAVVLALGERGADKDVDDDTGQFLLAIRTPMRPPVGDAPQP